MGYTEEPYLLAVGPHEPPLKFPGVVAGGRLPDRRYKGIPVARIDTISEPFKHRVAFKGNPEDLRGLVADEGQPHAAVIVFFADVRVVTWKSVSRKERAISRRNGSSSTYMTLITLVSFVYLHEIDYIPADHGRRQFQEASILF